MALSYDFTSKAGITASGVVVTRSGATVYPMLSASTVEPGGIGNNLPIFEDDGGPSGGGLWVFDAFQNSIASPFDLRTSAGWTHEAGITFQHQVATAPDGTTTASVFRDNSSGAAQGFSRAISSVSLLSGWFRLVDGDPAGAGVRMAVDLAGAVGVTLDLTTDWKRFTFRAETSTHFALIFDLVSQGAIEAWGLQWLTTSHQYRRHNLPLANGGSSTGMCTVAVPSSDLAALMDPSGNYDIEVGAIPSADISHYNLSNQANAHFFHLVTTEGNISMRWSDTSAASPSGPEGRSIFINVHGVDVATTGRVVTSVPRGNVGWREGDWVVPRVYVTETEIRIRYRGNCSVADDTVVTGSFGPLGTPVACWIGSQGTTTATSLKARLTHFEAFDDHTAMLAPEPCDILLLGDSTMAYINDSVGVGPCVGDAALARTGFRIGNLCAGGDSVSGQTAKFLASAWNSSAAMKARCHAVFQQGWVNDINSPLGSVSVAQITAATNDLTDDIHAAMPHARVVFLRPLPADGVLDATDEQQWIDVCSCADGVPAGGGVALTGLARVITSASDAHNTNGSIGAAGTNTLIESLNSGDDLHQTNEGYQIIGDAIWATYLEIAPIELVVAFSGAGTLAGLATRLTTVTAGFSGAASLTATMELVEPPAAVPPPPVVAAFRLNHRGSS